MTDEAAERRALRPLWLLTTGAVLAATAAALTPSPGPRYLAVLLTACGALGVIAALAGSSSRGPAATGALWLMAGLALVGGRGLDAAADRRHLENQVIGADTAIRVRVVVLESWTTERWGLRTRVRVLSSSLGDQLLPLAGRCGLELRGVSRRDSLPRPGSEIEVLARVRGSSFRPLLVAAPRLLTETSATHPLPLFRDRLSTALLASAGTDIRKIRAAETASALALGRRDLVPRERRDRWRRSGLAHVLAVSGLHVGLVGGAVWLLLAWSGASPRAARLILILVLPSYALLAGAAPSAMRAALMGVIYLGARLLGRAIVPMAAVLLTASCLLTIRPGLVLDAGFQLTIIITAALVRWVPPLTRALSIPRWLSGAVAVPVVAQTAAVPLVAWHFRSLIPGAILANLIVLPLIAPTVLLSVAAAVVAPIWSGAASFLIEIVFWLTTAIGMASSPARSFELVAPHLPLLAVLVFAASGWVALQPGRRAIHGAVTWIGAVMLTSVLFVAAPGTVTSVEALPVGDGAAVLVRHQDDVMLVDAGRFRREASMLLADARTRKIGAVIASHTDEDHIGGIVQVLETMTVDRLMMPLWMTAEVEAVPLLRAARRRGVRVFALSLGVQTTVGKIRVVVVWPPPMDLPRKENERSVVLRSELGDSVVLLTSDIGRETEFRLARRSSLDCDVLVVAHHGSRGSSSELFLNRATPAVAVIPAGSLNTHDHPHKEVLKRLDARQITTRWPARNGWCGARLDGEGWVAFP